jgi:hypothetical protein
VKQWRHLAFCLSLLNINEKAVRKLLETFKSYAEALQDAEVYASFEQLLAKVRRSVILSCSFADGERQARKFAKPDQKQLATELEARINARTAEAAEAAAIAAASADPDAAGACFHTDSDKKINNRSDSSYDRQVALQTSSRLSVTGLRSRARPWPRSTQSVAVVLRQRRRLSPVLVLVPSQRRCRKRTRRWKSR